jgi:hypothetical protein
MVLELERYKRGLQGIMKYLAKQDFEEAVEILETLISDIDYHINSKEMIIEKTITKGELMASYGIDGLQETAISLFLLTKVIDVSDSDDEKVKNIYLRVDDSSYRYDKKTRTWFISYDC